MTPVVSKVSDSDDDKEELVRKKPKGTHGEIFGSGTALIENFGSYRILVLLQLEYQKEEKNMTK